MIFFKLLNQNQKRSAVPFIVLLTIFITSCQFKRNDSNIIIASAGKISSLDPAQANTFHSLQLISSLGDTLYRINSAGTIEPRLAKDMPKITDNGLTISIPLREDVFFHDGTYFNSYAMEYSLRRFMEIGIPKYIIGGRIKSIETPEVHLLRLRLNKPSSSIERLLTSVNLTPISPTAYKKYSKTFLNKAFIGTGPYKLKTFSPHKQTLEPFELYWGEKPKNNGISFISLSNSTSLFSAMRSGEIDVLLSSSINESQRLYLNNMSNKMLLNEGKGTPLEIGYITLRSNDKPLNNQNIRKAISYTIDRDLITKRVTFGLRSPLRSLIPPKINKITNKPWPIYDPQKARKLMEQEGFCAKKKLTLPITYRSNVPADKLLALTWKEQLDQVLSDCLILELNGVESTTVYRLLGEGAYSAIILDWRGSYPDPEAYLSPLLSCNKITIEVCEDGEAAISGSFWSTKVIQNSLKDSDQLYGEKRFIKLNEINKYAADGSAYIPIWLLTPKAWSQKNISEPLFDGSGQILFDHLKRVK